MNIEIEKFHEVSPKKTDSLIKPKPEVIVKTETVEIEKKSHGGYFLSLVFFIGFAIFIALWLDVTNSKEKLETRYSNNVTELQEYKAKHEKEEQRKNELQKKYDELHAKYEKLNAGALSATFIVGKNHGESDSESYDSGYKVFFDAHERLLLKSVWVRPENIGPIEIVLYNKSGSRLQKTGSAVLSEPKKWQKIDLLFAVDKGRYYLTFVGNTDLLYHSKKVSYPYKIENIITITGVASRNSNNETQSYYQYFYDWEIALSPDE